jgi:hypothetical protein
MASLLLLTVLVGASQNAGTRLTVSQGKGRPGTSVTLPVYLVTDGVRIAGVKLRISFPGALASFEKAETALDSIGVEVRAEVEPRLDDQGRSVLALDLSSPEGNAERAPISDGPIARVTFRISKDAKAETEIPLVSRAVIARTDDSPKKDATVTVYDGTISVIEEEIISCFFYMH